MSITSGSYYHFWHGGPPPLQGMPVYNIPYQPMPQQQRQQVRTVPVKIGYAHDSLFETIDDSSTPMAKQTAFAVIMEEISYLKNSIRDHRKQIVACQEKIRFWQIQQNKFCGVGRLPKDVLLNIFTYFAHNAGETRQSTKEWLRVTQVCSHWRQLALDSPMLWRWLCVLVHPTLASILVKRAAGAPLTLVVDYQEVWQLSSYQHTTDSMQGSALSIACQHMDRIKALALIRYLIGPDPPGYLHLRSLLNEGKATELESIDLIGEATTSDGLDLARVIRGAPRLKSILLWEQTLPNSIFQSSFKFPQGLTILDICMRESTCSRLSLSQVLSTLKKLPNLKSLRLHGAFKLLTPEDINYCDKLQQPISLPSLRDASFVASVQLAQRFWEHITYPPSAILDFGYLWDEGRAPGRLYQDALQDLLRKSCEAVGKPILSLGIWPGDGSYHIYVTDKETLRFYYLGFGIPAIPSLVSALPHLDVFRHLKTLIYNLDFSNTHIWKGFGSLDNLSILHTTDVDEHPALLQVLATFRPSGDSIFEPIIPQGAPVPRLYFDTQMDMSYIKSLSDRLETRECLERVARVRGAWRARRNAENRNNLGSVLS